MRRPPLLALALALLVTSPRPVRAQADRQSDPTELAQQRFREATEAYESERYAAAASLFEAADRLAPRAATRYNAATAWEQAGEAARAATGYEAALALGNLDDHRRDEALTRLAVLKKSLARVQVNVPLGALLSVDHVQRVPVPATFYLAPGDYDVTAEYSGELATTHAQVAAGSDRELTLTLPESARALGAAAKPEAAPPFPTSPPGGEVARDDNRETWGWVGVGAGIAFGVAAAALGVKALSARDRFQRSDNTDGDAYQDAKDLRLATNLLWGGATAAGATGLVLLLTAPSIEF